MKIEITTQQHDRDPIRLVVNGEMKAEIVSGQAEQQRDWEKELHEARLATNFLSWVRQAVPLISDEAGARAFLEGLAGSRCLQLELAAPGVAYPGSFNYKPSSNEAACWKLGDAMSRAVKR